MIKSVSAWIKFKIKLLLIILFFIMMLYVMGCSDSRAQQFPPSPGIIIPTQTMVHKITPRNNTVFVLAMLDKYHKELVGDILKKVDETKVKFDDRIPIVYDQMGPPPGWTVTVLQSGSFPTEFSSTGFATGIASFGERKIYVMYKLCSIPSDKILPALAHEYSHAWAWHLGLKEQSFCINHNEDCSANKSFSVSKHNGG